MDEDTGTGQNCAAGIAIEGASNGDVAIGASAIGGAWNYKGGGSVNCCCC